MIKNNCTVQDLLFICSIFTCQMNSTQEWFNYHSQHCSWNQWGMVSPKKKKMFSVSSLSWRACCCTRFLKMWARVKKELNYDIVKEVGHPIFFFLDQPRKTKVIFFFYPFNAEYQQKLYALHFGRTPKKYLGGKRENRRGIIRKSLHLCLNSNVHIPNT